MPIPFRLLNENEVIFMEIIIVWERRRERELYTKTSAFLISFAALFS
jgi:hypothetical protein